MECIATIIEAISNEISFVQKVASFHINSEGNEVSKSGVNSINKLYTHKLIMLIHIIFIILIIIDLILTNLYSQSLFPLYTSYISSFLGSELIIVNILFGASLCCGCYCCLNCGWQPIYWCRIWAEGSTDSSIQLFSFDRSTICIMSFIPFLISVILFTMFLTIFLFIFCFSPSLLLYIFFSLYTLSNNTLITLTYLHIDSYEILYKLRSINETMDWISCVEYGQIHYRLFQCILSYILWPNNDPKYEFIQQYYLNEMNKLFQIDINEAIKYVKLKENSYDDNDNINKDYDLRKLINTKRMKGYAIFCIVMYIIIILSFWICYIVADYDKNKSLFRFYVLLYCIYLIFLFGVIWILWVQLKLHLKGRYGSTLRILFGSNGQCYNGKPKYKFNKNKFVKFYNIICQQYNTMQCLNQLFNQNHGWMHHFILKYLMVNDLKILIHDIYGEQYDNNEEEYWYDPNPANLYNYIAKQNKSLSTVLKQYDSVHIVIN